MDDLMSKLEAAFPDNKVERLPDVDGIPRFRVDLPVYLHWFIKDKFNLLPKDSFPPFYIIFEAMAGLEEWKALLLEVQAGLPPREGIRFTKTGKRLQAVKE